MEFEVHVKTPSIANMRTHWAVLRKIKKTQRELTLVAFTNELRGRTPPALPVTVWVTRIAPRELDEHDNLKTALKSVVDEITAQYGKFYPDLKNDRDPRIEWCYRQKRRGVKEYAVGVLIEGRGP